MPQPRASNPSRGRTSRVARALQTAVDRGELSREDKNFALQRLESGRQRPRTDPNGRREDILQAAVGVFATKGYHGATLQDIAAELGLTRPTLYYYYKSKQQILEAICLGAAEAADAVIDAEVAGPASSPSSALHRTLSAYAEHIVRQETTMIMMRNFDEMSPEVQREVTERRRRREGRVLEIVLRARAGGELSTGEPKIAVLSAFELIHSVHNWFSSAGRLSRDQVAGVLVDLIMNGLSPRRG